MSHQCGTCRYIGEVKADPHSSKMVTICRVDSPKTFLVPVQTLQGQQLQATVIWPQVDPVSDWCGKHDRDPEKEPKVGIA